LYVVRGHVSFAAVESRCGGVDQKVPDRVADGVAYVVVRGVERSQVVL
jgi:hypothetical protein